MSWILQFLTIFQLINGAISEASTCSFHDESTGYHMSWSSGVGFVDFFFNYKHFPTRTAHWTGLGFGDQSLQLALIESQYERVTISSAAMQRDQPPLKLPTANMVTRGYGSIDEDRLEASFSVPIYYFQDCGNWTFFTIPTQVGQPYTGTPKVQTICNVTNVCIAPKIPQSFKAYPDQANTPTSVNIQLPSEVSQFLDQPIDADFDIKGGLHLGQDKNGVNVRYSPSPQNTQNTQSSTYNNFQGQYDQQYGFPQFDQQFVTIGTNGNQQSQLGFNGNQQSQLGFNGNQQSQLGFNNSQQNQPNQQSQFNSSAFTVYNPNYKYLPEGLGLQYESNSNRQRFYDNNGNPTNFGTSSDEPVRSNADQNKLNYQEISTQNVNNPQRSQQFTNNIYGYDYRSNPGNKYTLTGNFDIDVRTSSNNANSGNEQQYQPPQNQRFPNGRRKKRQTTFKGTAYENQDAKFPRVENTIPMSNNFDDSVNSNTNNNQNGNFNNPQKVFYDSQNGQNGQASMYYPYRTNTNGFQQPNTNQFDSSVGPLTPYYITPNSQNSQLNGQNSRQFDPNPFSTNRYNPASPFYNQTQSSDLLNNGANGFNGGQNFNPNDNTRFNPNNHPDTKQYDGNDPPFCKDYVKKFQEWFKSYGGSQTQGLCPALKQSLYHTDHHCQQSLQSVGC